MVDCLKERFSHEILNIRRGLLKSNLYIPVFDTFIIKNRCNSLCIVGYNDFYLCHGI